MTAPGRLRRPPPTPEKHALPKVHPLHFSPLAPRRTLSSHGQVVRALGSEIISGRYPPGANLPSEPELLTRFQISRPILREALKTLAAKGLVVQKTRVGTRVLDPVNWNLFDAEVLSWKADLGIDEPFRQSLVEIRRAVEPSAAALAAQRATPSEIEELRECVAQMRVPGQTAERFAVADLEFHLAVAAASGNVLMRSLAAVIETVLVASFSRTSPVDSAELQAQVADAHGAIVDAIARKDGPGAATAMLAVISAGDERYGTEGERRP
ncbi:FadR/GntR family transcriptional regulator [Phenylobacterium sp. J367]|uniref:FadR/GntR family transcriptional regulator n=1 Tax=Phenylobacterium sp. J367 TaxID=2898435 RepID=UPI002151B32F|nr:FadR/GntR family transcriptional regulator [Phenylobacterium sp. J367]MCR5879768.1 FadR family transcriptional regulator [Phenylobacterium sp. J367]